MPGAVGYNPDDPVQSRFLNALALGETGNSTFAATEGFGGSNLAGAPTDAFGFPQWTGLGNSHAAGTYQFQPATWDTIAQQYGLNFANPADQSEGAWYLAQQVYAQKTGGSLEDALSSGNYGSVQSALAGTWTSVVGNQSNPQGLAATLNSATAPPDPNAGSTSGGIGGLLTSGANMLNSLTGQPQTQSATAGLIPSGTSIFARGGLILIGAILIIVALWAILSNQGYVPSPRQLVRKIA